MGKKVSFNMKISHAAKKKTTKKAELCTPYSQNKIYLTVSMTSLNKKFSSSSWCLDISSPQEKREKSKRLKSSDDLLLLFFYNYYYFNLLFFFAFSRVLLMYRSFCIFLGVVGGKIL